MARTILVTGAAGFIGSNFVRMLMGRGEAVKLIALDKLTYAGNLANLHGLLDQKDRLDFVRGDICDAKLVSDLFDQHGIREVVHFAAESHVDRSILGSGPFVQTNVIGTQVLLDSGVPLVLVPCKGVTTHLHSTVAEIERYVEPCGAVGAFLAQRFKEYFDDHAGGSKVIWDMATIAYLLDESWTPSVLLATPIVTSEVTWSVDQRRPLMRYVRFVDRDPIFKDFFRKLKTLAA